MVGTTITAQNVRIARSNPSLIYDMVLVAAEWSNLIWHLNCYYSHLKSRDKDMKTIKNSYGEGNEGYI